MLDSMAQEYLAHVDLLLVNNLATVLAAPDCVPNSDLAPADLELLLLWKGSEEAPPETLLELLRRVFAALNEQLGAEAARQCIAERFDSVLTQLTRSLSGIESLLFLGDLSRAFEKLALFAALPELSRAFLERHVLTPEDMQRAAALQQQRQNQQLFSLAALLSGPPPAASGESPTGALFESFPLGALLRLTCLPPREDGPFLFFDTNVRRVNVRELEISENNAQNVLFDTVFLFYAIF